MWLWCSVYASVLSLTPVQSLAHPHKGNYIHAVINNASPYAAMPVERIILAETLTQRLSLAQQTDHVKLFSQGWNMFLQTLHMPFSYF